MSGGTAALWTMAAATAASTAYAVYSGEKQSSAQNKAQKNAEKQARAQSVAADQELNRANQKAPDTNALLSAAQMAGKQGGSSTLLTGAQGIDPNALNLGKNSLLGQ
jgi:hypothetical protein